MSFSPYPEDDAATARPDPSKRRQALAWAGGVSAAIVALAAAGWLVFGDHGSGPDRAAGGGSVVRPATPEDSLTAPATPGGTVPASGATAPSRPVGPGAPTGGPGTPAPGLPVSYRVATDLCPLVDLTPLAGHAGPTPSGSAVSDRSDNTESGYTNYTCKQLYTSGGWAYVQAEIFGDPAAAGAQYANGKANAPKPTEEVAGVGTGGYGFLTPGSGSEAYTLWVQDGNLYFGVNVHVKAANLPGADTLRAAAVSVARAALPKLRG